jgi:hypothetical protein
MRIIGGKDYYDSAAQFGVDTSVCFVRNNIDQFLSNTLPLPELYNLCSLTLKGKKDKSFRSYIEHKLSSVFVVIADKAWQGIRYKPDYDYKTSSFPKTQYFWTMESFEKFLVEYEYEAFTNKIWFKKHNEADFDEKYFGEKSLSKSSLEWMINNKIVVMVIQEDYFQEYKISYNRDDLKNVEFFRLFDAFQTHQMIEQYVTGVLPNAGNEMVKIDDKIKFEKHGFWKWSFKTPGKKGV